MWVLWGWEDLSGALGVTPGEWECLVVAPDGLVWALEDLDGCLCMVWLTLGRIWIAHCMSLQEVWLRFWRIGEELCVLLPRLVRE